MYPKIMQDFQTAPTLEFPPAALQSISTRILYSGTNVVDQNAWTGVITGQQWGNGIYEVRASSVFTDGTNQWDQLWQIFDKIPHFWPAFANNHYATATGEYSFGIKAGYTLDSQYYGKPSCLGAFCILWHIRNTGDKARDDLDIFEEE